MICTIWLVGYESIRLTSNIQNWTSNVLTLQKRYVEYQIKLNSSVIFSNIHCVLPALALYVSLEM